MSIIKEIKILSTLLFLTIDVFLSALFTKLFFKNYHKIKDLCNGNPDAEYHADRLMEEYYKIVYGESENTNVSMEIYDPSKIFKPDN